MTHPGSGTDNLFDERPIELGGFRLHATGADLVDRKVKPTIQGWQMAFSYACSSEQSAPLWVGDLLNYAETRADWREKLSQAVSVTGLSEKTLRNRAAVAKRVGTAAREVAPSVSHLEEVAKLDEDAQVEWLEAAKVEGWNHRELRVNIAASKRRKVISGQAVLEGQYRVIYADPPWSYRDSTPRPKGSHARASEHYASMTIEELCKLPVAAHALPNSVLFLWVTAPMLLENPGPRDVIEAWGFTPKAGFVWDKVNGMPGAYNRVNHEHLILATRGTGTPDRPTPQPDSVFVEKRGDIHSGKPASVRHMIEKLYDGPYLELFGRERVSGWTVFGNDARLWHQDMEKAG